MEIKDFYNGRSILITGGSGFLGMVIIEKLLFSCDVKNIYMLMKPKKGKNVHERLELILNTQAFQRLNEKKPGEIKKIIPVVGDILEPNLGLKDADIRFLQKEISVVFHAAANINVDVSLINAINVNTRGAQKLIELCKGMEQLSVFVYVSSAYSQSNKEIIDEIVYNTKCRLEAFNYVVDHLDGHALEKSVIDGRPNTYTYSKALAEEIVSKELAELPVAIIRPSIITPSLKEPVRGWLYGWSGANLVTLSCAKGTLRCWNGDPDAIVDIVPVDIVANLTIAAAYDVFVNRDKQQHYNRKAKVFNCCSGLQNPLKLGHFLWGVSDYGKQLLKRESVFSPKLMIIKWWILYAILSFFLQTIPAYFVNGLEYILGRKPRMMKFHKQILELGRVLGFFTLNQFLMTDYNVRELHLNLEKADKETFNVDVSSINWDDYIKCYVVGLKTFLLKET